VKEFPEHLIKKGKLKLDYKVRQVTHDFLINFVEFLKNNKDIELDNKIITKQNWFHLNYKNDITITNLINNFFTIIEWLEEKINEKDLTSFLEFIEEDLQLSYFDIKDQRHGEELYIYMNSRGRHLVENETLKAKFLSRCSDSNKKNYWGQKWEEWQDFFWKNKLNNPDSDNSFNEFLRVVQIISMVNNTNAADRIYNFINEGHKINFNLLPSLEKIENYFNAYKLLVENNEVKEFFSKYENKNYLIDIDRKQIDYFRIIPLIVFIAELENYDDNFVIRFVRFIYNISRKKNVSKDIRAQLVTAVKLFQEYGSTDKDNYDIIDLISYNKGRTVLLDNEEIIKLNVYKSPSPHKREELENLFWAMEDHKILSGEISFLLNNYYDEETITIDYNSLEKSWISFENLFSNKSNYKFISKALLYYGNTWKQETPYYYDNYNCQDWEWLISNNKGRYLLELIQDMCDKDFSYIKIIIKQKISNHFKKNNLTAVEELKQKVNLIDQLKILVAVDFYTDDILWTNGGYIAEEIRYYWDSDPQFFNENKVIFNIRRYVYGGETGRILLLMKDILEDEKKLSEIIEIINK